MNKLKFILLVCIVFAMTYYSSMASTIVSIHVQCCGIVNFLMDMDDDGNADLWIHTKDGEVTGTTPYPSFAKPAFSINDKYSDFRVYYDSKQEIANVISDNLTDESYSFEIYSITGQLVLHSNANNSAISVNNLSSGVYCTVIKSNNFITTYKFIK